MIDIDTIMIGLVYFSIIALVCMLLEHTLMNKGVICAFKEHKFIDFANATYLQIAWDTKNETLFPGMMCKKCVRCKYMTQTDEFKFVINDKYMLE